MTLPEIGTPLPSLPRNFRVVRDLEVFEGPLLSQLQAPEGGAYIEKWCTRDGGVDRSVIVRSDQRAVAQYLARRMTLLDLLSKPSDGIGFLVDRRRNETTRVSLVAVSELPTKYLPTSTAIHDESLRPAWQVVPQYFLVDANWNARLLARVESWYLDVAAFSYFTAEDSDRALSPWVLAYHYRGGYAFGHTYKHVRGLMPEALRARSVGVSASSPGVLTIDAPRATEARVMAALKGMAESRTAYELLYAWARRSPEEAKELPPEAMSDLERLSSRLGVRVAAILPRDPEYQQEAILVAGKLLASYYRKLEQLLEPDEGVEFISASALPRPGIIDVDLLDDEDDDYSF